MEQQSYKMSEVRIIRATEDAKERANHYNDMVNKFNTDIYRKERLYLHICKSCYYLTFHIGGAMTTNRKCDICSEVQTYRSTYTDVLCKACAIKYKLCKHCGGDIEMKIRRKPYLHD